MEKQTFISNYLDKINDQDVKEMADLLLYASKNKKSIKNVVEEAKELEETKKFND